MKKLLFVLAFVFFFAPFSVVATENPTEEILNDTLKAATQLNTPNFNFKETAETLARGELNVSIESILQHITDILIKEVKNNTNLLIKIIAFAVLSGILCNLQQTSEDSGIADISFLACFTVIAGLSVTLMAEVTEIAITTIDSLMLFIAGLMPVMGTLSLTAQTSAAIGFYPGLFTAMQTFVTLCKVLFLPLISAMTVLSVTNALSGRFHISRLIDFGRQTVKWGLGLLLTVFVGILSLHSFTAGTISVAGRTAKYAISNFVPLVGSALAESAEIIIRSTRLIRGVIGTTGVLALFSICFLPLMKIVTTSVLYRFAAGIAEPATDKRIIRLLMDLSGNITLIFSIVLMVTVMFIISIAMLSALIM